MPDLTLQALLGGRWRDMALLEFPNPERGADGPCNFEYLDGHLVEWLGKDNPLACASVKLPVEWGPRCLSRWPVFLDDLRPLGASRQWWMQRLNLSNDASSDFTLLKQTVMAPIGHLRIKEAVPPQEVPKRFPRRTLVDRERGFLEYASDRGAQVGGATGAGGDSPKVLVRLDAKKQVWIDAGQDDPKSRDAHYLVKFARGERTRRDRLILQSEYVYYRALERLGVDTISTRGMRLEEGDKGPSLWLPRFDVAAKLRLGVESISSVMGAPPGAWLKHEEVIAQLRGVLGGEGFREVLLEYLRRDLLNLVFGNTDNHGRNLSLLKTPSSLRLAPVYDFAPMELDLAAISRTTRWAEHEHGGDVDWAAVLKSFGGDEPFLRKGLKELAKKLRNVRELLVELELPEETLERVGFAKTGVRLKDWGLL